MIKTLAAAAAALALTASAGAALAGDIVGTWATPTDNGRVQISHCGAGVCARLVDADQIRADPNRTDENNKNKALRSRKAKGLVLFQAYAGGPPEWKGGEIYDPKTGDTGRSGKLKLISNDKLEVKGCFGPICRTQQWTRVN